jgi:hypothetical protein
VDVDHFLNSYKRAFDEFDHRGIAGHYHYPSLLASADSAEAFVDRAEAERRFKSVCDNHRRIGYKRAVMVDSDVEVITDNLCRVTVLWKFLNDADDPVVEFVCTYTLAEYGTRGPLIIAALVHN